MLSAQQIEAAIDYNRRQGYCVSEIKLTQRTVGAIEDGVWGPETVTKVAAWQPLHGLKSDGKVGPATWAEIKNSWELVPTEPPPANTPQIGCGLAAYDQTWPGHTPEEAMQKAWDTAVAEGCLELRFWSSEWLIDDMGNKGNSYSGPWLASQHIPMGTVVGAWIDDPVSVATSTSFVARLIAMQVSRAALMINRSNTRADDVPWSLRWSEQELRKISNLYRSRNIDIACTTWPRPSRSQIDAMCEDMAWVLQVTGSSTFEVDTEGNWKPQCLQGFGSMQAASEYLASRMRELVGFDGTLELTTYTYHTENSSKAVLAPLMDRLLQQAYSVRHRGNQTVGWDDSLGPGRHQTLAITRARQAGTWKS